MFRIRTIIHGLAEAGRATVKWLHSLRFFKENALEYVMHPKSEKAEKTAKKKPSRTTEDKLDDQLDEALEETFPASDPPAQTQPTHVGGKKKPRPH